MPTFRSFFKPASYRHFLDRQVLAWQVRQNANWRGVTLHPPGHFYSPLLDIKALRIGDKHFPNDWVECWEHIRLCPQEQRQYYQRILEDYPIPNFPRHKDLGCRYFWDNHWFPFSDALALNGVIKKEKPSRIIEVGSGFSSAVMLDTLDQTTLKTSITFIEPHPERLSSLLTNQDREKVTLIAKPIQDVPLSVYDELEANDILFIDSSHVAKVGSDVTFILLRVLPRLKSGVIIHFHDIVYPSSYPMVWLRDGCAWNESLFLRAFLVCNYAFEMMAFNSFAAYTFPEVFKERVPKFLENSGGSFWMRKLGR
jgi:hypothetical protein